MNIQKQILREYIEVYKLLYEKRYILEHNELSITCCGKEKFDLTWTGRNAEANITFDQELDISTIMEYLLKHQQFSMLFYDKSILQVEYKIEAKHIVKQRLQFIKKCNKVRTKEEIASLENMSSEVEGSDWFEEETGIPVFIRVDYDPINHVDLLHSKSHFVISNVNNCRIPMKRNLSLKKFVELILNQVYNDYSTNFNNLIIHEDEITDAEKLVLHFDW